MMKLDTLVMGAVEIDEQDLIRFQHGLPGFEEVREYVLLTPDPELPFSFLQALTLPELHFLVVDPFQFFGDYGLDIPQPVQQELDLRQQQETAVFSIVTVTGQLTEATANLLAPVVINIRTRLGKQLVLHDSPYTTKHRLFPESQAEQAAAEE